MLSFDVHEFDEVTSTNDVVKQAVAEGAPEGFVAVAQRQSAGYGRRGHAWRSEPGSLYMSVLLRPREGAQMQTLPLVAAVAVRRAITSFLPDGLRDGVMLKWPNDVVSGAPHDGAFDKLCGISVEGKDGAICLGIGVNVSHSDADVKSAALHPPDAGHCAEASQAEPASQDVSTPLVDTRYARHDETNVNRGQAPVHDVRHFEQRAEGPKSRNLATPSGVAYMNAPPPRNNPTYICDLAPEGECPTVLKVRNAVLGELAECYDTWQKDGFASFREEYDEHSALRGQTITIEEAAIAPSGSADAPSDVPSDMPASQLTLEGCKVLGISPDGCLEISSAARKTFARIASGSITIESWLTQRQQASHRQGAARRL